jgi:sigma-B regulation protein RsbU (phosphoserine phosphatase)
MNQPHSAVREIMSADPVTVGPDDSLATAVELMGARNIGAVVVVNGDRPVGILTERDLVRRAATAGAEWNRRPVRDAMTSGPVTIDADLPWEAAFEQLQARKVRHLPVVEGPRLVGMLSVRDLMQHRSSLLEAAVRARTAELVRQQAILEERDSERTRNLGIAGRIQRQFLPDRAPAFDPFRIAFAFHPYDQVAGDYYDFELLDPDTLCIVIGDAAGHGVSAAFVSVMAKTCFHHQKPSIDSPAALLRAMNHDLHGLVEAQHFISMFVATLHRSTRELTFARAGHPLPLLLHGDSDRVTPLDAGGVMIGLLPEPAFVEQTVRLQPGDKVLFYTDGVIECPDADGQLFGKARLAQVLSNNRRKCGDALLNQVIEQTQRFTGRRGFDDDVTLVLLESA